MNGTVQSKAFNSSGRPSNLEKSNQYSSSEVSVQSLSYSPVSTDLGKHYTSDFQEAAAEKTARPPAAAELAVDDDVRPENSLQVVATIEIEKEKVATDVSCAKSAGPPEVRKPYMDDSVPMHQTLWDKLASSSDNPELSPWGTCDTPPPHNDIIHAEPLPSAQKLSYDTNLEGGYQVPQFSGEGADTEIDLTSDYYQEPPVWQPFLSDEGYTYYYNNITGETRWEIPTDNTYGGK